MDRWYAALPGVTSAVGALVRDLRGRVLIAQPTYKQAWVFIGGTVDAGESPLAALRREVIEELGPTPLACLRFGRLLVTDWVAPRRGWNRPMHHLIFDCGSWDGPPGAGSATGELSAVEFLPVPVAMDRMDEHEARRLEMAVRAVETGQHYYLHNGMDPNPQWTGES
jgi:8-oxo-dGTP pyrophosphatase MutT (NUDIX family)